MALCGARLRKRTWLTCRKPAMRGYERCVLHAGLVGGYLWRHGDVEAQEARQRDMQANRLRWIAEWAGGKMPMGPKAGDAYWTPGRVASLYRRFPDKLGWKRKAAAVGALPCSMAVSDPAEAERLCLWARPNRDAVLFLPPKPKLGRPPKTPR